MSSLARSNICRLTSFKREICPSVWPFDHGCVCAAATAILSFRRPPAMDLRKLRAAASIQVSRSGRFCSRIMAWKRNSRALASSSIGTSASIVATRTASAFVRLSRPVVIRPERIRAEGTLPGDPSGARSPRRRRVAHSPTTRRLPVNPLARSRRRVLPRYDNRPSTRHQAGVDRRRGCYGGRGRSRRSGRVARCARACGCARSLMQSS